jgi:hypothetical protein
VYVERQVKPRRADDATRIALVTLSWLIDWRRVLTVVKPDTLVRWHRKGFRLFWRWKSPPRGRPRVPADVRREGCFYSIGSVAGGWLTYARPVERPLVQCGARRHGKAGIYGDPGNLESVTYRIYKALPGSNPTLSATFKLL